MEHTPTYMKSIAFIILLAVAINAVVIPNSLQVFLAISLFSGALIAFYFKVRPSHFIVFIVLPSFLISMFYILIGVLRGAPGEAVMQTMIIYIISPLLWVLVIDMAWKLVGVDQIVNWLGILAVFAALSVGLYIFLFLSIGPHAVSFFKSNPNVNLNEGYSAVIMHVSGSLIFLGAAFVAEPTVIRSTFLRLFLLVLIAFAAFASGRTMAILALIIGFFVLLLANSRQVFRNLIMVVPFSIVAIFTAQLFMELLLSVDLLQLLERHFQKISGGDRARPEQIFALINGAESIWFLGAGHGVGVDYIRSYEFPWRYEAVFIALLYKLGIVGSLVVLLPILLALILFFSRILKGSLRKYDSFFGAALIAVCVAGLTNPYPEAFTFQWIYLLPIYHFLVSLRFDSLSYYRRSN